MKIEKNTAVTLRFKLSELNGKLLEETKQPVAYLHGGYGNVLPKIEEALEGQTTGYKVTLDLQPEDAFGERDESLVETIPRSQFQPGVQVGGQSQWRDSEGGQPKRWSSLIVSACHYRMCGSTVYQAKESDPLRTFAFLQRGCSLLCKTQRLPPPA